MAEPEQSDSEGRSQGQSPGQSDGQSEGQAGLARIEPTASPRTSLESVLARARVRLRVFASIELLLALTAGAIAALLISLILVGLLPYSTGLRLALVSLIPFGAAAAAFAIGRVRVWPLRHDVVVAARLEEALLRRGQQAGDMVRGAVELLDETQDAPLGRSRALCRAHIDATAEKVVAGRGLESLGGVALERALPTGVAFAVLSLTLVLFALLGRATFTERWEKLFSAAGAQRALDERAANALPLVTDLKLILRFPAYMQEPDEVIPGSSGDVLAPKGTEVIVEGRADRPVESATLMVGAREMAVEVKDGRTIVGRFTVSENGVYRFKINPVRGISETDPVAHKITVRPDAAPTVTLDEPAEDRTVKIDEEIALSFGAKDDVGVTKFRVVVRRQGSARDPYTKDLLDVPGGLREARGNGRLIISETGARPGDRLSLYVEALDNDDVSGPKPGRSQTRVLTVFSAKEQHKAVIARLEDVLSKMVDSLGDELEAPVPDAAEKRDYERHEQIQGRHTTMMTALDDALVAMAQDEMAPAATRRALANIKLQLVRAIDAKKATLNLLKPVLEGRKVTHWRRLQLEQKTIVTRLEHAILYIEDLLNKERIAQARQIADDLKRAQEDLAALIEQYKKSGDPQVRQALLDEIQRMRKQMAELMEQLAKLQRDMPDEFLNQEAFEADEMMQKAMDIDQMIEEGKLDEAAAALKQMLESTEKLMEGLDESGEQFGGEEYKELREKMQRFSDELQALEEGQEQILNGSQAMMDRATKATEERLKGKLDKALGEIKKKVENAQKSLESLEPDALFVHETEDGQIAKARAEDLLKALESADLDDAVTAAEEAEAAARSAERSVSERARGRFGARDKATLEAKAELESARSELESARKMLQELIPDPSQMLSPSDRQQLGRGADRQDQLGENAQRLQQLMDEIGKEAPIFGPEHKNRMQQAQQMMQRAAQQMRAQNLRGARSSQRQAMRMLQELGKDMQQAGGGQGGGIPMPLPRGGSPGSDDMEGRGRDPSTERVEIPDGSGFKVPDQYRKDILDAMREGAPESWQQEVKRYYEKLIK